MANRTFPSLPETTLIDDETLVAVDSGTQTFKTKGSSLKTYFVEDIESRLNGFVDPQIEKFNDVIRSQFCSSLQKNTFDTTLPRQITQLAYSPKDNLIIATCSFSGTGSHANRRLMGSQDLGQSWFSINYTAVLRTWQSICYSPELELFVAVSRTTGSNQQILTSPNGVDWTIRLSPSTNVGWESVVWSSQLGIFVAVGDGTSGSTTQSIMTSEDGFAWTARTSDGSTGQYFVSVVWAPALNLFVAAGSKLNTSPDGINWTSRTITNEFLALTWSQELSLFCASVTGGNTTATSPDGINWTYYNTVPVNPGGIVWCNKPRIFVMGSFASTKRSIYWSKNGINWNEVQMQKFAFMVVPNYVADRLVLGHSSSDDPTGGGLFSIGPQLPVSL